MNRRNFITGLIPAIPLLGVVLLMDNPLRSEAKPTQQDQFIPPTTGCGISYTLRVPKGHSVLCIGGGGSGGID